MASCFTGQDTPAGCFLINTSATLAASSHAIAETIKSRHAQQEQLLLQFLMLRQQRGEIPASVNTQTVAEFLGCIVQGMSSSAREGASCDKLLQVVRTTMRLWPTLVAA